MIQQKARECQNIYILENYGSTSSKIEMECVRHLLKIHKPLHAFPSLVKCCWWCKPFCTYTNGLFATNSKTNQAWSSRSNWQTADFSSLRISTAIAGVNENRCCHHTVGSDWNDTAGRASSPGAETWSQRGEPIKWFLILMGADPSRRDALSAAAD